MTPALNRCLFHQIPVRGHCHHHPGDKFPAGFQSVLDRVLNTAAASRASKGVLSPVGGTGAG